MRARELAVGILGRNGGASRSSIGTIGDCSASWDTGEDTPPSLRAHNLRARRFPVVRKRTLAIRSGHWVRAGPDRTSALWMAKSARRHRRVVRTTVARGSRRNWLGVALRSRCGRQESLRRLVPLRGLTLGLAARVGEERRRWQAVHGSVRSNGCSSRVNIVSRSGRITRHIGTIGLAHVRIRRLAMMRLQWRKRVRL